MSFRKIIPGKLLPRSPRRINRNGKDGENGDNNPPIEEESKSTPAGNDNNGLQSEPLPMRRLSIPSGSPNEFQFHSPPSTSEMSIELSQASPITLDEDVKLETVEITKEHKDLIRKSWKVIIAELGQSLCYVGGTGTSPPPELASSEPGKRQLNERTKSIVSTMGVSAAFIRLFEEYPQSREFFTQFKDTPIEEIQSNVLLSKTLQDHSVRVFQLVEKVIGRMEPTIRKSNNILLRLGKFHRTVGIPCDYFDVMGPIFLHAIRPSLEQKGIWDEDTEEAWLYLFSHITRTMTHGHKYAHLDETPTSEVRPRSKSFFSV